MVELIGDPCFPSWFGVPISGTTTTKETSGTTIISGTMVLNQTSGKLEYWDGQAWQTITSTVR